MIAILFASRPSVRKKSRHHTKVRSCMVMSFNQLLMEGDSHNIGVMNDEARKPVLFGMFFRKKKKMNDEVRQKLFFLTFILAKSCSKECQTFCYCCSFKVGRWRGSLYRPHQSRTCTLAGMAVDLERKLETTHLRIPTKNCMPQ